MKRLATIFLLALINSAGIAQSEDSTMIRNIYDESLVRGESYKILESLCKDIGARLSGSAEAEMAVEWGAEMMRGYGLDSVWLQDVMVPKWVRGNPEAGWYQTAEMQAPKKLHLLALGGSIGTDGLISGEVVEVKDLAEIDELGEKLKGKIVFINKAMDPRNVNTFRSYGGCYPIRGNGAARAGKYGALGVIIRSLSLRLDYFPHTGSMRYEEGIEKIPAAAISTRDAALIKREILDGKKVTVSMRMDCENHGMVPSHNVIGEIRGSEEPDKIILIGGHLDSWDVGEGAHDDGAGIAHSIEALRILKAIGYKPKYTIRCVLFMNEENGNNGGKTYAKWAKENNIHHISALESDRGGFAPRGFTIDGTEDQLDQLRKFQQLLEPYNLHIFDPGYGGVDIGPLKDGTVALIGLVPDSQRYFNHHHANSDVFESVEKRELELGAASCAALLYLIDQHGIGTPKIVAPQED